MSVKFSDLIEDVILEFNDPNFEVFNEEEVKKVINSTQHEGYPRIYRRTYTEIDPIDAAREYDLSSVDPEVREVDKVYVYPTATSTKPNELRNWIWDQYQKKLRFKTTVSTTKKIKIEYRTGLSELTADSDVLDIFPEVRSLIKMMAVRTLIRRLLLDRVKMDKYRTTIDDQTSPYILSNIISSYDRDIELKLREVKIPLIPSEVKKPERSEEELPETLDPYKGI